MAEPPIRRYPRTLRRAPAFEEVQVRDERPRRPLLSLVSLPLLLVAGFALAIAVGTLLLALPFASADGDWTSLPVAFFVATSSVCVTGLTPVDTGTYWSGFGEAVILVLIQFGGLGFMTSATLLFLLFGWRVGLRERLHLSQSLDLSTMGGVVRLTRRTIVFTLALEAAGFVVLFLRFLVDEPPARALWWGLFHSVSAFNNAGFDVFGGFRSLETHADAVTLGTISALVVVGGLGYLVVDAFLDRKTVLSFDAKIVVSVTAALLVLGFVLFLVLEWNHTLAGRELPDKALHAWFQSVTPRTAGFNSVPVPALTEETSFFLMSLMFIGGGSGSTAGGIKVGTLAVILAATYSTMRGRQNPEIGGREIRRADVDRALTVAILGATLVFLVSLVLVRLEAFDFLALLFETTSAFGTVGLTRGVTPQLGDASLLLLALTMFLGRLGPLTLVLALVQHSGVQRVRRPEEHVRVG